MRRERMTQPVWRNWRQFPFDRIALHALSNTPGTEPVPARVQKQGKPVRTISFLLDQDRSAMLDEGPQRGCGPVSDRYLALLPALPGHPHAAPTQIEIL